MSRVTPKRGKDRLMAMLVQGCDKGMLRMMADRCAPTDVQGRYRYNKMLEELMSMNLKND